MMDRCQTPLPRHRGPPYRVYFHWRDPATPERAETQGSWRNRDRDAQIQARKRLELVKRKPRHGSPRSVRTCAAKKPSPRIIGQQDSIVWHLVHSELWAGIGVNALSTIQRAQSTPSATPAFLTIASALGFIDKEWIQHEEPTVASGLRPTSSSSFLPSGSPLIRWPGNQMAGDSRVNTASSHSAIHFPPSIIHGGLGRFGR